MAVAAGSGEEIVPIVPGSPLDEASAVEGDGGRSSVRDGVEGVLWCALMLEDVRLAPSERVGLAWLLREHQEFVAASFVVGDGPGFAALHSGLREGERGCGIVVGRPGEGRTGTAVAALTRAGLTVRPLMVDIDEDDPFQGVWPEAGRGYLIDVSGAGPLPDGFLRALRDFASAAAHGGAALVVIADPGQWDADPVPGAAHLRVRPPEPREVLAAHLGCLSGDRYRAARWARELDGYGLLRGATPAEAAALARIAHGVLRGRERGSGERERLALIRERYLGGGEIASWFAAATGPEGVWHRVVVAALAVLEGEPVQTALAGARGLAEEWGVVPRETDGIDGIGIGPTLERVGARRTGTGEVFFEREDHADRVLDHLWAEHPGVRAGLTRWAAGEAVRRGGGTAHRIGARLFSLFERCDDPRALVGLFDAWVGEPDLVDVVVSLASAALVHPRFARSLRERLYEEARAPASVITARVVARVCAEYGKADPAGALTRLKWLVEVDEDAEAALRDLARYEGLHPALTRAALGWIGGALPWNTGATSPVRADAGVRLLEALMATGDDMTPVLLARHLRGPDEESERLVGAAWYALLEFGAHERVRAALASWMRATSAGPEGFDEVVYVLGCAVAGLADADPDGVARRAARLDRALTEVCAREGWEGPRYARVRELLGLVPQDDRTASVS
ncbi:hypothetical protein [Nocardiopsis lambiniae]|uniref:Uncharacterized protein n=1 Tax=Nocardiopsis lambiniae TaxID=3075539 RepID=A0ABU2M975_9ACTN|nr:hypothetical protein [Nocardiopsis sp. DSM 44743]MDT0329228.1 hypothetical protein [Nocardiopsis sp. DSM 44743]